MNRLREITERVKRSGDRFTNTRRVILIILYDAGHPLTVAVVIKELSERGIKVNKTTVYRQMAFLVETGAVNEVRIEPNVVHYELSEVAHRHHLVCRMCGNVENVDCTKLEKYVEKFEREIARRGFSVRDHSLEFYGICGKCV